MPKAVAHALGLQEDANTPLVQALCAHCASRRLLLVLDNCEHLVDACASLVDALLRAAPDVRVLASSREALNVAGEQTYPLPPLSLPDPQSSAADAERSDAGRLFVERARLRQPAFALSERNVKAVAQICARLDGIPLALELAAARVGVLTVEAIAERLHDRFRLLTGGARAALPRQQTLRALIDWSYDLLGEAEKTLFARLSVFAGGFRLPAAEDVCADRDLAPAAVLDLLTGLANKSLVVPDGNGTRYRMLETIRDYARDRLQERGESVAVRSVTATTSSGSPRTPSPTSKAARISLHGSRSWNRSTTTCASRSPGAWTSPRAARPTCGSPGRSTASGRTGATPTRVASGATPRLREMRGAPARALAPRRYMHRAR